MEKSNKRGKIPQSDWPLIMTRYEAGETLASIARTYDCSPPAISYVVSRSKARQPGPEPAPAPKPTGGTEPQLIKAAAPNGAPTPAAQTPSPPSAGANGHDRPEATMLPANGHGSSQPEHKPNGFRPPAMPEASDAGNGTSHPAATNGDHRGRLHLSLGNPAPRNGGSQPAAIQPEPEPPVSSRPVPAPAQSVPAGFSNGHHEALSNGASRVPPNGYPQHLRRNDESTPRKDGGAFIDSELRARVDGDIAVFLAAFDAALGDDTHETRAALREATDRLLRAGARTRIELERLEARMPLPPRNDSRAGEMGWRPR